MIKRDYNWRMIAVVLHDAMATALALILAFAVRFDAAQLSQKAELLLPYLPLFVIFASSIYALFRLYRSKWRFASLPDLANIFKSSLVLAGTLLALDYIIASSGFAESFIFGKITLFLYAILQMFTLGAARLVYRYYRFMRSIKSDRATRLPALLVGNGAEAEMYLRALESQPQKNLWPIGLLLTGQGKRGQSIRQVKVLGTPRQLERILAELDQNQLRPHRVLLLPSSLSEVDDGFLGVLRRNSIPAQRLSLLGGLDGNAPQSLQMQAVEVEDLLFRDSVAIDYLRLGTFVGGKKIAVTGGAGSIGSELCVRALEFGCAELLVIDHSEAALFAVQQKLESLGTATGLHFHLADVQNAARIGALLASFKPDYVLHAAALKHVPIVETDWAEGLLTNILGTQNVCEAALDAGAQSVVIISTDKAVNPVSILGLSKRFGEYYAAARDASLHNNARVVAVRFGNVLGSSGSVVPRFKSQIAKGGPVYVTHQAMVRYFMTVREACDLVLTSASHAAEDARRAASVYVLDMGQPVRILDLAKRMIRLSGFEPETDIAIEFSGIRPGERLNEALFAEDEQLQHVGMAGISAASTHGPTLEQLDEAWKNIHHAIVKNDRAKAVRVLQDLSLHKNTNLHLSLVRN